MSTAVPFFVALMPDAAMSATVQAYKDRTRELVGPQLYLDDPPHTTAYLAAFPAGFPVPDVLRAAAIPAPPQVRTNGWHSWVGDPLTGRNTLVCAIAQADKPALRRVQRQVADALAPHRDLATTEARFAGRFDALTPQQRENVRSVGFPFLGDGWEPHVTIASILPEHWPTVIGEFESRPPGEVFHYARLDVFELHGVEPVLRGSYDFPR
ncbi:2'-5' RNA ligase family protein [Limnoglobus roseus]|uniref:2'-5' RNA ligase family protein n=1 Tax=Limnoglobus roseus TaxID=2598579 RepID=A0A5C1AQ54_9BACT|nr:2'-5' RNA ligase family protein [Limnoglobus roseus]QEL20183.1 hypothetical protein PX52LOC_07271 [Limnoglobus roseus]